MEQFYHEFVKGKLVAETMLLSFAHDFAKQGKTIQFDAGSKTAITQSILHGFAWYFLCTNANVLLIC